MKKALLGVVALVAALLVGLVIGTHLTSVKGVSLGITQTPPSHVAADASVTLGDSYLDGNAEVQQVAYFDGAANFYSTTTLGYTPNQVNVTTTAFSSLKNNSTALNCVATNSSGASWVVKTTAARIDLNAGGSTTGTLVFGVTTTPSATTGVPSGASNVFFGPAVFTTSSAQQVFVTSSASELLVPTGSSVVLSSTVTSTASGNCVFTYTTF